MFATFAFELYVPVQWVGFEALFFLFRKGKQTK